MRQARTKGRKSAKRPAASGRSHLRRGIALGTGGAASAAHCVEGDNPVFSYFGTDQCRRASTPRTTTPARTPGPQAPATCAFTGSPSERGPGKQ